MKKKWMLTAIISIVVVLVGLFGLIKWNEHKKTEVVEPIETKIFKIDPTNFASIEIYNGQSLIFNKQNELWVDAQVNELEYEQDKLESMIAELGNMASFQMISNVQDESVYGIDENSKIITAYDKTNVSETIRIGNDVSGQDASYIWSDKDEVIYLVAHSQLNDIFYTREDVITKDMNVPSVVHMEEIVITENDKKVKFKRNPKKGTAGYDTWLLEEAFKTVHEANNELVESYLEEVENFKRDKFVTMDTSQLEAYGLDEPSLMIQINGKYTIKFGKVDGDYTYFKYSESPYIYKMLNEKVKPLIGINGFDLIRKGIYVPHRDNLVGITLQQGNESIEWTMSKPVSDKAEVDKMQGEGITYIGDVPVTLEQTDSLLSALGSISLYKPLVNPGFEEKQERTAEVMIAYHLKDGTTYSMELVPYDPSYYILRYEGHIEFSVDKKSVVSFFNEFNRILKEQQKEISNE